MEIKNLENSRQEIRIQEENSLIAFIPFILISCLENFNYHAFTGLLHFLCTDKKDDPLSESFELFKQTTRFDARFLISYNEAFKVCWLISCDEFKETAKAVNNKMQTEPKSK